MNVIDTNIWVYRYDFRDSAKQKTAERLVTTVQPLVLLWQVGCEFIAASRKLAPYGFTEDQAWSALADMQATAVATLFPDTTVWAAARTLQVRHALSFWDALLVAACIRGGVQILYTEDMGAPRVIDGISLVNPFLVP
jgi:predicted nucleic acid-binding protein